MERFADCMGSPFPGDIRDFHGGINARLAGSKGVPGASRTPTRCTSSDRLAGISQAEGEVFPADTSLSARKR